MSDHYRELKKRSVYINDEDFDVIKERAQFFNMANSRFIREMSKYGSFEISKPDQTQPKQKKKTVNKDPEILELKRNLTTMGSNFNQLQKKINQGKVKDTHNVSDHIPGIEYLLLELKKKLKQIE